MRYRDLSYFKNQISVEVPEIQSNLYGTIYSASYLHPHFLLILDQESEFKTAEKYSD